MSTELAKRIQTKVDEINELLKLAHGDSTLDTRVEVQEYASSNLGKKEHYIAIDIFSRL